MAYSRCAETEEPSADITQNSKDTRNDPSLNTQATDLH